MALTDILKRIERDGDAEAAAIVAVAEAETTCLLEEARSGADSLRAGILKQAEGRASRERETVLANARLQARDRTLAARIELATRVLRQAEEALTALPDDEYAAFLAQRIAVSVRGGERVLVAEADGERLAGKLKEAVAAAIAEVEDEPALIFPDEPSGTEHGVLLAADRISVEISPSAFMNSRRGELMTLVSSILFGEMPADGKEV